MTEQPPCWYWNVPGAVNVTKVPGATSTGTPFWPAGMVAVIRRVTHGAVTTLPGVVDTVTTGLTTGVAVTGATVTGATVTGVAVARVIPPGLSRNREIENVVSSSIS